MDFGNRTNTEYSYGYDLDYSYLSPSAHGNRELESLFFALADRIESEKLHDSSRTYLHSEIPIGIFSQRLSGLQSIVKFLREEKGLRYSQISRELARDQRTIWAVYSTVKKAPKIKHTKTDMCVSTSIFCARRYSILESISSHLKKSGYSTREIAKLLGKSPKTIWTVLSRAQRKRAIK